MPRNRPNLSLPQRLWQWGCSLKLAITIASLATLLIMGGSLIMHRHPEIFGPMDRMLICDWLATFWRRAPLLVWWVPLSGACLVLFGINTLCCLCDWLLRIRSRWRKCGEYLIHTGFILLVVAYAWSCVDGFRSGPHRLYPGERLTLPKMPGYTLELEQFTPELSDTGRPLDMRNQVALRQGDRLLERAEVRTNHPLMHRGLVVLPASFGRSLNGFRFHLAGQGLVDLFPGKQVPLADGGRLELLELLPNARPSGRGGAIEVDDRPSNPTLQIRLQRPDGRDWQGWYFLRGPLPRELAAAGLILRPVEPLFRTYSLLTVNRDPGIRIAAAGAGCMLIGVLLACCSFYLKRARGDRPEI